MIGEIGDTIVERLFGIIGVSPVESLDDAGKRVLVLSFGDIELDDRGNLLVALVANTPFMFGCVDATALDGIGGNVLAFPLILMWQATFC